MENQVPIWTEPTDLGKRWPVREVESPKLSYHFALPSGWERQAQAAETQLYSEETYHGGAVSELASVSYMPQADPDGDIRNWVEGVLAVAGFPIPELAKGSPPELLEWAYEGSWPALTGRLGVDECHTYQGLAYLPETEGEVARFYILLARRGQQAWKVTLSFLSACLPGTEDQEVYENDHVRAGATFGALKFL
ncbi:MAG: hypothetical protein EHM41_23050 [Chloroflexi bacterium]|nr:MAG: hypothetical protein EHM41_23050 [Chloroflexota bacterium]